MSSDFDEGDRIGKHKWKLSWPGNFCLACGMDDPVELAVAGGDDPYEIVTACPKIHDEVTADCECGGYGMIIDTSKVPPCEAA